VAPGGGGPLNLTLTAGTIADGDQVTVVASLGFCTPRILSKTISVTVVLPPDATITPAGPFCEDDAAVNLTAATPGGTWSGPGITDAAAGTFDPAVAGIGTHTIEYTVTDGPCTSVAQLDIEVQELPDATITPAGPFCADEPALNLTAATAGGTWSGAGITDAAAGTFDPATAGPGVHTITYELTVGACTVIETIDIEVKLVPVLTGPADPIALCDSDSDVDLLALVTTDPAGGTLVFSGTGVTGNTFSPAGLSGTIEVTATYTLDGCPAEIIITFIVTEEPELLVPAAPVAVCENAGIIDLETLVTVDPAGGTLTFSGTNVTGSSFDPTGQGGNTVLIEAQYSLGACTVIETFEISVQETPVVTVTSPQDICENVGAIDLTALVSANPVGGTFAFSGTGVTGASFDPTGLGGTSVDVTVEYTLDACTVVEVITFNIQAEPVLTLPATPVLVCETAGTIDLLALVSADPAGGTFTFSGNNVTGTIFDPVGQGGNTVQITVTYEFANCITSEVFDIEVTDEPMLTVPTEPVLVCDNAGVIDLTALVTFDPAGGTLTFTGTGVTGSDFDPAGLSGSTQTIQVEYAIGACIAQANFDISVIAAPVVTVPATALEVCSSDEVIDLLGLVSANPAGGTFTFSGAGVTGNEFNPDGLGGTTATITVTYELGTCTVVETFNIDVIEEPLVTVPASPYILCFNSPILDLTTVVSANLAGGTFSFAGGGVTGNEFDPAGLVGTTQLITVTYDYFTCQVVETFEISVLDAPVITVNNTGVCESTNPVLLTDYVSAQPAGGTFTFTGDGVTGDTFDPTGRLGVTVSITVDYDFNGCINQATLELTVLEEPELVVPAGLTTVCEDNGVVNLETLVTTNPDGGTLSFSGVGVTGTEFDPTGQAGTTVTVTATYNVGGCEIARTFDIQVDELPVIDIPVNPVVVCATSGSIDLTTLLSATPGGGILSFTGTGVTGTMFNPTGLSGSINVLVSYELGACVANATLTLEVTPEPELIVPTEVQAVCENSGAVDLLPFVSVNPAGGTVSFTGTGVTGTSFNPTGLGGTTVTISVTYDLATCTVVDAFDIQVDQAPVVAIDPAGPFCPNDLPVTLSATPAGGVWAGNGITDVNAGTFDPAIAGSGAHIITYEVTNGACVVAESITINISADPNLAITPVGPFCTINAPVNLQVNAIGGTWAGPGITNSVTGVFSPAAAGDGTHTISYTLQLGACTFIATTEILVVDQPDATITPVGPVCSGDTPFTLTAASPGGTWSGTGIIDSATGLFDPSVAGEGIFTITYSINITDCEDEDSFEIEVIASPAATLGDNPTVFCVLDAEVILEAFPAGGDWTGPGITDGFVGVFDPAVAGVGDFDLVYSVTENGCTSTVILSVSVFDQPDATITVPGGQLSYCSADDVVMLTAATAGGQWIGAGVDATTGEWDPALAGPGTHVIRYEIAFGSCDDFDEVTLEVTETPEVEIDPTNKVVYCITDGEFTLLANLPAGSWSSTGAGLDPVSGVFNPGVAGVGSFTVTYSVDNGGCIGEDTITIEVFDEPVATITTPAEGTEFCSGDAELVLTAATAGGTWSGAGITDAMAGTWDPAQAGAGTHIITYVITYGDCSDQDEITFTVEESPEVTLAPGKEVFCTTDAIEIFTASPLGGVWSGSTGIDPITGAFNPALAEIGTYEITYTVAGAICSGEASFEVTVAPPPVATIDVPAQGTQICQSEPSFTLTAATAGGTWSGQGVDATSGLFSPGSLDPGVYTIAYTISIGNCTDTDEIDIEILPAQVIFIDPAGPFCNTDQPYQLNASVPGGTWSGTGVSADGIFNPAVSGFGTFLITYTVPAANPGECPGQGSITIFVNIAACSGAVSCSNFSFNFNNTLPNCGQDNGVIRFANLRYQGVLMNNYQVTLLKEGDSTPTTVPNPVNGEVSGLPAGNYTYQIFDFNTSATCTGTVTLPFATSVQASADPGTFEDATCFGTPTGRARINATGSSTGQYYYSTNNGASWALFTPGNYVNDLPPNGTYNIFVGESQFDPCPALVTVTINNGTTQMNATFTTSSASCDGNDGSITITSVSGGTGSYTYRLDGIPYSNLPNAGVFANLSGGAHVFTMIDAGNPGCERNFTITVPFPGLVNFDAIGFSPDCSSSSANNGLIRVILFSAGTFDVGLSQSITVEPSQYIRLSSGGGGNEFVDFTDLVRGDYFVWVTSTGSACPSRQAVSLPGGPSALGFDLSIVCNNNMPSVLLTNISGSNDGPIRIQIFRQGDVNPSDEIDIPGMGVPMGGSFQVNSPLFNFPSEYSLRITQVQQACEPLRLASGFTNFFIRDPLTVQVANIQESFPERPSGRFTLRNFQGGLAPFMVRAILDSAAVEGQNFSIDWDNVPLNANFQFEYTFVDVPAGRYAVDIMDANGCIISVVVRVPINTDIFIPNIFTPNGDGSNDTFFVRNLPETGTELIVTNRWGRVMYTKKDYANDWDGEGLSDGVYFYRLKVANQVFTGWVEILRGPKP
jgi:large repetitive protein